MKERHVDRSVTPRDDTLQVPSKAEVIAALQQDGGRAGLQLEWVLDRCDRREGEL